jgi:predicted transcriptional regulator
MPRKLYEIAADIIEAQATMGPMTPDALEQTLSRVFVTLQRMKMAEDGGFLLDQAKPSEEPIQEEVPVDPKSSIQDDKIICLECGKEMKQLTTKHVSSHGLTVREYKIKWGFSKKQSLSAISLSKARSKASKKRGLPEKLLKFQEQRRQEKAAVLEDSTTGPAKPITTGTLEEKSPVKRKPKTKGAVKAPVKKRTKKKAE